MLFASVHFSKISSTSLFSGLVNENKMSSAHYDNLFVAKLPRNLTDRDLMRLFSEFKPESAKIMLDATTGKSKGFGFVRFSSAQAGKEACEALVNTHVNSNGHNFTLRVFPSEHDGKAATEKKNALFIRNIPSFLSAAEVQDFLGKYGTLTRFSMREDDYDGKVWVVFAAYDSVKSATKALHSIHGKLFFQQSVPVLAKYEESIEQKLKRRKKKEMNQNKGANSTNVASVSNDLYAQPVDGIPPVARTPSAFPTPSSSHPSPIPPVSDDERFAPVPPLLTPAPPPPPPPPVSPHSGAHDHFSSVFHYPLNSSGGFSGPFFPPGGPSNFSQLREQHPPSVVAPDNGPNCRPAPLSSAVRHDIKSRKSSPLSPNPPGDLLMGHSLSHLNSSISHEHHTHQDYLDPFAPPKYSDTPDLYFDGFSGVTTPVSSHSRSDSLNYRHNPYPSLTIKSSTSNFEHSHSGFSSSSNVFSSGSVTDAGVPNHYSGGGYNRSTLGGGHSHFAGNRTNFLASLGPQ